MKRAQSPPETVLLRQREGPRPGQSGVDEVLVIGQLNEYVTKNFVRQITHHHSPVFLSLHSTTTADSVTMSYVHDDYAKPQLTSLQFGIFIMTWPSTSRLMLVVTDMQRSVFDTQRKWN